MKKITFYIIIGLGVLMSSSNAQIIQTSNQPSETSSRTALPSGPAVYGVFVGRTPCQELLKELNMGPSPECEKRKMGFTLYQDPVTHEPTTYYSWGMGKWTGKGKWHIRRGMSGAPDKIVFQLELDTNTSLLLLKGDENTLFILDQNKDFLVGNANFSYTMNRAKN